MKAVYFGYWHNVLDLKNAGLSFQDLVPLDTQLQFGNSREHMKLLTTCVGLIKDVAERMVSRQTQYASDMLLVGKQLR